MNIYFDRVALELRDGEPFMPFAHLYDVRLSSLNKISISFYLKSHDGLCVPDMPDIIEMLQVIPLALDDDMTMFSPIENAMRIGYQNLVLKEIEFSTAIKPSGFPTSLDGNPGRLFIGTYHYEGR